MNTNGIRASACTTLALAATLTLVASPALAVEPAPQVASPAADTTSRESENTTDGEVARSVQLDGWLGVGARLEDGSDSWQGVPALGVKGLYGASGFAVGAVAELSGGLFEDDVQHLGVLGGIKATPAPWFTLTTLAEVGMHLEQPSESTFMRDSYELTGGETSSAVPYVGLRVDPMFRFGRPGENRFILGPTLGVRRDLDTTTQDYTAESCGTGLFSGEYSCSTGAESNRVGGLQLTAGLTAGIELAM